MMNGEKKCLGEREKGRQYHNETVGICEDGTSEMGVAGLGGVFWLPGM